MHSFGKMLKALPHHSRDRSRSRDRGKSPGREAPVNSEFGATTANRPKWNLAPQKSTDPIITIKPAESDSVSGRKSVTVTCSKTGYSDLAEVSDLITPSLKEDIRWFIEDFSRQDVLNRERALNTRIAVRRCCEQFVKELKLDEIVEKLTSDIKSMTSTIIIQVEDNLSRADSLYELPWEILEHPSLWPEGTKYDTENAKKHGVEICVKRKATATKKPLSDRMAKPEDKVYKFEVSFSIGTLRDQYPTYNILVVSNRDAIDEDDWDSHFQIARPLYAAINGVDENIHVHVEVCRPATWSVFKKYLENRRKGFWNVVHLDMPVANGSLHFDYPEKNYDAVPDYEVAEVLHKNEVRTVFLTCNDAREKSTVKSTALATAFVAEEIPVVVSAPFLLPKIYLMLMSSGFYQSILSLHRKGPSYGGHVARKAMQTQEIDHLGRYHIPVKNTIEGLGLIVYDNGNTDSLDIQQFCYPNTAKTPSRFGPVGYQDVWLFGRDLEIMRLESKLLSNPATSNIQWITGKRSVGKSMLLSYLTYWWGLSGFIQSSVYIDLGQALDDFGGVLAQFAKALPTVGLGETPADKHLNELKTAGDIKRTKIYKDMVKLLRNYRLYVYYDNVDHWRPTSLEKTPENEQIWASEKKLFLEFVEELRGGPSFVILVCPYNNQSIRGNNPVFELKPLKNHHVQQMYGIVEWDTWVEGTSSISVKQTMLQQETTREITEFHDAVVECTQGLMAAKQQFVYNLPFKAEQRTRDILILMLTGQQGTAGPYNMDTSPSVMLIEHLYDLVIRDRNDLEDKSPDANANILRLMLSLSTFFERIPKDITYYLVLLWYYDLFTPEWSLPGKQFDHQNDDRAYQDDVPYEADFAEALEAFEGSRIKEEWDRLLKILIEHDYVSPDPEHSDEYYILNPTITFCMRKVVYASEGPLTMPILPVAIRFAAQDFYLHRYRTIDYRGDLDKNCRVMLEKTTIWSMILTAIGEEGTSLRSLLVVRYSPFRLFSIPKLVSKTLSASDKRLFIYISGCIANFFDTWITASGVSPDTLDSEVFYEVWCLAYICGQRMAVYHNATSYLADSFNDAVLFMRRCKAFGQRYDEAKRDGDGMLPFDDSLRAAEETREELISMGILKDEGAEDGREAPPAYAPAETVPGS